MNNMNLIFKKSNSIDLNKKGFTLIETLVAISILSLSILAGFTAVQNGLKASLTAKNQITAFYLVQEAMEFVKNKRDENALIYIDTGVSNWLNGLSLCDATSSSRYCQIDSTVNAVTACPDANTSCSLIRIQPDTGLHGYTGSWTATNFKRAISYQRSSTNADEATVTIWISWTQGAQTKTFQVTETLFNRLQ